MASWKLRRNPRDRQQQPFGKALRVSPRFHSESFPRWANRPQQNLPASPTLRENRQAQSGPRGHSDKWMQRLRVQRPLGWSGFWWACQTLKSTLQPCSLARNFLPNCSAMSFSHSTLRKTNGRAFGDLTKPNQETDKVPQGYWEETF